MDVELPDSFNSLTAIQKMATKANSVTHPTVIKVRFTKL